MLNLLTGLLSKLAIFEKIPKGDFEIVFKHIISLEFIVYNSQLAVFN
jgi:hypothetical protein